MGSASNRVIVVTGASRGAGRGIATALGETGATVYVTGRTREDRRTARSLAQRFQQELYLNQLWVGKD